MRIVLLYPPPWKIAAGDQCACPRGEGPPPGLDPAAVEGGDFLQAPYGLLSLAREAEKAGPRWPPGALAAQASLGNLTVQHETLWVHERFEGLQWAGQSRSGRQDV